MHLVGVIPRRVHREQELIQRSQEHPLVGRYSRLKGLRAECYFDQPALLLMSKSGLGCQALVCNYLDSSVRPPTYDDVTLDRLRAFFQEAPTFLPPIRSNHVTWFPPWPYVV